MHEMVWLDRLPAGTLESGKKLLNDFLWHITLQKINGFWCVYAGECIVYQTDSEEAADAFIYGLALAHAVLPEHIAEHLQHEIKKWSL